jgi:hypothetical protein
MEPIRHWLGQLLCALVPAPSRLEIARLGQRAGAVGGVLPGSVRSDRRSFGLEEPGPAASISAAPRPSKPAVLDALPGSSAL